MKRGIVARGTAKVKRAALVVGVVSLLLVPCSVAVAQEVIFEMDDPVGDDYGPGTYVYPMVGDFVPDLFDLTHFRVSKTGSDVVFEFTYRDLGGNPWGSQYGFSFQFQQVYIDQDGKKGSGRTDTVGANLLVDSANAWEAAITVGPYWDSEPQANWTMVGTTTHELKMAVSADEANNTVIAAVPISVYAVITGPWDMGHMRAVGIDAEDWLGGGADTEAVIAGVAPLAYDILVPEGMEQTTVLQSYDTETGTFAAVPAVPPGGWLSLTVLLVIIGAAVVIAVIIVVIVVLAKRKK